MTEDAKTSAAKLAWAKAGYETDALLSQYLSLHFGPVEIAFAELLEETGLLASALDFPKKCGLLVNSWQAKQGSANGRALDLGCAVGRSTFEMARAYEAVVGIDLSQRFIDAADHMKQHGSIDYALKVEGDLTERAVARVDPDIDVGRVTFQQASTRTPSHPTDRHERMHHRARTHAHRPARRSQGDACMLPEALGRFDACLAANLLCRVPDPHQCLQQIDARLNPGALLVCAKPCQASRASGGRLRRGG